MKPFDATTKCQCVCSTLYDVLLSSTNNLKSTKTSAYDSVSIMIMIYCVQHHFQQYINYIMAQSIYTKKLMRYVCINYHQ